MRQSELDYKLRELIRKCGSRYELIEKKAHSLQETFDFLQLCIVYLLFNSEATQRENEYLRKLLKEKK